MASCLRADPPAAAPWSWQGLFGPAKPPSPGGGVRNWGGDGPPETPRGQPGGVLLLRLAANLLPIAFPRQRLLRALLVARLQIEAVLLDVLDDVFLLDLALETPEGVFDRLALLDLDFGQNVNTPSHIHETEEKLFSFGYGPGPGPNSGDARPAVGGSQVGLRAPKV